MNILDFLKTLFPQNKVEEVPASIYTIKDVVALKQEIVDLNHKLVEQWDSEEAKIKILTAQLDVVKNFKYLPDLPIPFQEASSVYCGPFLVKTSQGDYSLIPSGLEAGGHLTLTSYLYRIIDAANILPADDALTVFNKILGVQQKYCTYVLDQDQWGARYTENWTPAIMTLATRKDDCESLSAVTVSAFQYYQLQENKFPEAYAFVGTGLYNKSFGHGFPCLFLNNGKSLDESLFIGEATLHVPTPAKSLSQAKELYYLNWGANSFWHDFTIKPEFAWWTTATAVDLSRKQEFLEYDKKEKKEHLEKFWYG